MKKFKTSIVASILLAVISLDACKKNSSPPVSSGTSKLSFQLSASKSLASTPDSVPSIAGLIWTSGIANISKFSFEAKRNGVSIEIESHNLTNVDLFALSPIVTYVTLDTGTYKEIEIRAFLEQSDSVPSLKLTGNFTNGSAKVVPIEFDLTNNATIKAEANDVVINGTTDYVALVSMELNKLTKGVSASDLDNATLTSGKIIISNTSNNSIYHRILSNISGCGKSEFRDEHHKDND